MIKTLSFISLFVCPNVKFTNKTDTWTSYDAKIYEYSSNKCKQNKNNPCMIEFIKFEERVYVVLCGLKRKNS